jgi:hypothetical protein
MSRTELLQLREFHVHFTLQQTRIYSIEQLRELDEMIRIYGRGIISYITFFFHDSRHKFHSLTLRNSEQNDRFVVEFCHYYNQQLERVELSREQQVSDYHSVIGYLGSQHNFNSNFLPFIINPFVHNQMA